MFSLFGIQLQVSAERTWNSINQVANLLWYKFNSQREAIMPRSRRRHHSRSKSRSRSRSHSYEKDREVKKRKIDNFDSPVNKRSVSCDEEVPENEARVVDIKEDTEAEDSGTSNDVSDKNTSIIKSPQKKDDDNVVELMETSNISQESSDPNNEDAKNVTSNVDSTPKKDSNINIDDEKIVILSGESTPTNKSLSNLTTPQRKLTPKQLQRKLESEKKRQEKEKEKEEKLKEKERLKAEKLKEKQAEIEKKEKEKEEKRKEKEKMRIEKEKLEELKRKEKEQQRLEKEKKEEEKRKEKEQEKLKKQQEIDEKNKEKQKLEELKKKERAVFASFFKKVENADEKKSNEAGTSIFMPFEVKSDMKLPPSRRPPLTEKEREFVSECIVKSNSKSGFLSDIKINKGRSCPKTWPYSEENADVVVIEEEEDILGETICEEKPKGQRMKAKFLKFHENRRPAYYGTWRKKSKNITGRRPFVQDSIYFDYEVDSDDDWEEEEQGESLENASDDDKENEAENEDYEVDNEFFVPHGHLSEDELDEEDKTAFSPESQKQKLKLLQDQFDEDMQSKTHKMKARFIGCVWYNKDGKNVDEAIDKCLQPLAILCNGQINIKKRGLNNNNESTLKKNKISKELPDDVIRSLITLIHGNVNKKKTIVNEFMNYITERNLDIETTKANLASYLTYLAHYKKCNEVNSINKMCWLVKDEFSDKYNVKLVLPNQWETYKSDVK